MSPVNGIHKRKSPSPASGIRRKRLRRTENDSNVEPTSTVEDINHVTSNTDEFSVTEDDSPSSSKRDRREGSEILSSNSHLAEPKAGVIEKVYMRNFMCHSSFEICLNPRINFIVGMNGSGKSAVLTALVIGLGGKASATNRGSSLKDLVKKGTSSATIEVTLKNTGPHSFKRETYGDQIVIVRAISSGTGSSSYKIKATSGEVVSNKREELEKIVSVFNIQVDNPISILNQDTARTFLNNSDPHEKFKMFMKATQLEEIQRVYQDCSVDRRRALTIVNSRKEALGIAKKEVDDLERKVKTLESMQNYRKKTRDLEDELYWTVAISEEGVVTELNQQMKQHRITLDAAKKLVDKETEQERKLTAEIRDVEEEMQQIRLKYEASEREHSKWKEEAKNQKNRCAIKKKEYLSFKTNISRLNTNMNTLKQEIEKLEEATGSGYAAKLIQIQNDIRRLENEHADVLATIKTNREHYNQLNFNVERIRVEERTLLQEQEERKRNIEKREKELLHLKREANNSLTVFGTWVVPVTKKIEEEYKKGRFSRKPKGPLGAYINLKDASWAPALESFLGSSLKAYCVNSSEDGRVLRQIFSEVMPKGSKPDILISRFIDKVHDVSSNRVQSTTFETILDVLQVIDPVVCNSLIDQRGIEGILLIPSSEEAYPLMSQSHLVPRKCKWSLTKKGEQFYPVPNYRTYAGHGFTKAKFLQVSMKDAISTAEEDIKHCQMQRQEMDGQIKAVQEQLLITSGELNAVRDTIKQLGSEDLKIQIQISKLKDMEGPESNSVAVLAAELKEITHKLEKAKKLEQELDEECKILSTQSTEAIEKSEMFKERSRAIQEEKEPVLVRKGNIQSALCEVVSRKNFHQGTYNEELKNITALEKELKEQQETARKAVNDATKICSRIETERSPTVVEKELNSCRNYVKTVELQTGSHDEICAAYLEKKEKYNAIIENKVMLEKGLQLLNTMLETRRKIYKSVQRLIGLRVQYMFQSLLHQRRYKGSINIYYDKQTLDVIISPLKDNKLFPDTKALSGGERSYSTIAYIMALWDAVDPPFYFLDEFDVFMDKINRRITMDLLLAHSRQKSHFQFVFLTPQDTPSIQPDDPDVKIYSMEVPNRIRNTQ